MNQIQQLVREYCEYLEQHATVRGSEGVHPYYRLEARQIPQLQAIYTRVELLLEDHSPRLKEMMVSTGWKCPSFEVPYFLRNSLIETVDSAAELADSEREHADEPPTAESHELQGTARGQRRGQNEKNLKSKRVMGTYAKAFLQWMIEQDSNGIKHPSRAAAIRTFCNERGLDSEATITRDCKTNHRHFTAIAESQGWRIRRSK